LAEVDLREEDFLEDFLADEDFLALREEDFLEAAFE